MDTFAEISCYSSDKDGTLDAIKDAFREMERIEKVFNRFDEESEISKINNLAGGEGLTIGPEAFGLIERSIYYSRISGGNFDITAAPQKTGRYKDIILDKDRASIRFLDEDIKIDLGGIAKGYAVDRAKEILVSKGIENALVNIGGNMFGVGNPPGKKGWQIGIQHPGDKNNIIHRLNLKDKAVSTSGDYERPSHIIDPVTGLAARGVMSVTITGPSAEAADALSTAVFVMGIEDGLSLIESLEDIEAFIFTKDGKLVKSP